MSKRFGVLVIIEETFDSTDEVVAFLKRCREARGVTITEVGHACGMTRTWMSYVESGSIANVSLEKLMKVAAFHGLKFALAPDKPELYG